MTIGEKLEITFILLSGFCVFLMSSVLPNVLGMGRLLLYTSALLLFQSLIRDLWILAKNRKADKLEPQRKLRCMCVESTVGSVGILIGVMLLGLGIDQPITMIAWTWTILVLVVLGVGFWIKDFVFEWNPWRIYRDKDHVNIAFTWK